MKKKILALSLTPALILSLLLSGSFAVADGGGGVHETGKLVLDFEWEYGETFYNRADYGLSFDGANDWVDCGDIAPPATAMTVEAWLKPSTDKVNNAWIGKDGTAPNTRGWLVFYTADSPVYERVSVYYDGTNKVEVTGTVDISQFEDTYYYSVATWNGTHIFLYTNGVLSSPSVACVSFFDSNYNLGIGRPPPYAGYHNGDIDEVRYYDRSLPQAEITANYNSGVGSYTPYDTTGLVGWWHFNAETGTLLDYSGNGNDGTITGPIVADGQVPFPIGESAGNDGTPTFRTTGTNTDISAAIASQATTLTEETPVSEPGAGWTMIDTAPSAPGELYTEGGTDYPGGAEIDELATATKVPYMVWAVFLAFGTSLGAGAAVYGATHNRAVGRNGSLFVMWLVSTVVMALWVIGGDGVIPGWSLIPYGFACLFLMVWFNPFKTAAG